MRPQHPSGRPIAPAHTVSAARNLPRIPREEFLTPRLRYELRPIGFGLPLVGRAHGVETKLSIPSR